MSTQPERDREPIFSMHVDEYMEFIEKSENKATPSDLPVVRPPAGAPILTLEVDEMTVFTVKAIPAGKDEAASKDEKKESA